MKPKFTENQFVITTRPIGPPTTVIPSGSNVAILEVKKVGDEYRYKVLTLAGPLWADEDALDLPLK